MSEASSRPKRRLHTGPHRRVEWQRPVTSTQFRRWPDLLLKTEYQVLQAIESRHGMLWSKISRDAIVAGYAWAPTKKDSKGRRRCAKHRDRKFRRDGAASFKAMLLTLMYCADVRTGFVGRPRKDGGPWERYTLEDLAWFAFKAKDDSAIRQAARALNVIINLGLADPTIQINRFDEESQLVRGEPAVRRLNWDALCRLTHTTWYLQKAQEHAATKWRAAREKVRQESRSQSKANTVPALGQDDLYASIAQAAELLRDRPHDQVAQRYPQDTGDPPGE